VDFAFGIEFLQRVAVYIYLLANPCLPGFFCAICIALYNANLLESSRSTFAYIVTTELLTLAMPIRCGSSLDISIIDHQIELLGVQEFCKRLALKLFCGRRKLRSVGQPRANHETQ
jgi:hypothetical protein